MNPKINYALGLLGCVNIGSSIATNILHWRRLSITGEIMHTWGKEICGKSLCLSLNFAVNITVLKKKKAITVYVVLSGKGCAKAHVCLTSALRAFQKHSLP